MSVRRRTWGNGGEAWVVDFCDANGKRRLKTFKTKRGADNFASVSRAVAKGIVPDPYTRGRRPIEFVASLPMAGWKKGAGRESIAEAFCLARPEHSPTTDHVVLHVIAEMSPSSVICDVDDLLKPVLDALSGVAWVNDTQVCECLIRRVTAKGRHLRIRIWSIPPLSISEHHKAVEMGLGIHGPGGKNHVNPQT